MVSRALHARRGLVLEIVDVSLPNFYQRVSLSHVHRVGLEVHYIAFDVFNVVVIHLTMYGSILQLPIRAVACVAVQEICGNEIPLKENGLDAAQ
jgi:hypothetical protein